MNAHRHVSAHLCVHSTPCPRGCRGEGISADFVPCFNYQPPERGLHTKMPGKHVGSRAGSPRAWQCLQPTHPWGSHLPATHTPAQPRDGTRPACHEQLPSQRTSQLRSGSQRPPCRVLMSTALTDPQGHSLPPRPARAWPRKQPRKQPQWTLMALGAHPGARHHPPGKLCPLGPGYPSTSL